LRDGLTTGETETFLEGTTLGFSDSVFETLPAVEFFADTGACLVFITKKSLLSEAMGFIATREF